MAAPRSQPYSAITLDKAALNTILDLALEGSTAARIRPGPRSVETWQLLRSAATRTGTVTLITSTPSGDEWIPVSEAAAIMGTSERWVQKLCQDKELTAYRHGRRVWLISRRSAEDWRPRGGR